MGHGSFDEASMFESAFRDAAIGVALVALDGQWLQVNDALCAIMGFSRAELMQTNFQSLTHPDDLERDLTRLRELTEGMIPSYQLEKRYLHKSGRIIWGCLTVSLVRNSAKQPGFFISQIQDISAQKEAESQASLFFERSLELLAVLDARGALQRVNQAWVDALGWSREELARRPFLELIHPDDQQTASTALVSGASPRAFRNRCRTRSGSYRWLEWSTTPTEQGGFFCSARDVTLQVEYEHDRQQRARRRVQELLFELGERVKHSEDVPTIMQIGCEQLRAHFDAAHCLYAELSADRQHVHMRTHADRAEAMPLGDTPLSMWSPHNVQQMKSGRVVVEENTGAASQLDQRYRAAYARLELSAYAAIPLMRDGEWVALLLLTYNLPRRFAAEELSLLGAAADRIWARAEHIGVLTVLRASEAQYRRIVENAHEGILESDALGNVRFVNRRMAEMLGYEPEALLGRSGLDFLDEEEATAVRLQMSRSTRRRWQARDFRLTRRDGTTLWTRIIASSVSDSAGRYTGFVALVSDISERRAAEQALRTLNSELEQRVADRTRELARSLREKEVLLREIHHRVKNNLQVVCSLLNLQAMQLEDPALTEILSISQQRVRSIALVHERLYQSTDVSEVDFDGYVEALARDLVFTYGASGRGIACRVHASGHRLPIDVAVLCGLLVNELMVNALKHAFPDGRGGNVEITLSKTSGR
ncbi:MAG: domain S-box protein, partial [Myxococcaceae bacterium]|nr:domain S-box protein [Myxococcaceae bacterium]